MEKSEFAVMASTEAATKGTKESRGGVKFRDRIVRAAEIACQRTKGNLIEIGCYSGDTSRALQAIAQKYDRTLVCVDNWADGTEYSLQKVKKAFEDTVGGLPNIYVICQDAHNSSTVKDIRRLGPYCFALSDDGHDYMHHLTELITLSPVMPVGIIALDDIHHGPDVKMAAEDLMRMDKDWKYYVDSHLREAYLVRGM